MPRFLIPASVLALLTLAACGNGGTTAGGTGGSGAGTGGSGSGGSAVTDCKKLGTNRCFSNEDCTSASNRCENKGTTAMPVACCVPGARGTGMAGATCTTENDCATTCIDTGTGKLLCTKPCTKDSDCPSTLPTCVTLNTGIGMGSFCGP